MLNDDYREMMHLLKNHGCDFIIVGAYALAAHGFPRATGDIDIFISTDPDNARKVYDALSEFGAPIGQYSTRDLCDAGAIFQIGVAPCRIVIITRIDGVSYEEAAASAVDIVFEGMTLPFLSKACFITNKLAAGRPKDLADAAYLQDGAD